MSVRIHLPLLLAGLVAGCAAPALTPDGVDHPANPAAPVAPMPPQSQTLALLDSTTAPTAAPGVYSCPHHPEVVSARPGDCPKCGMALTPRPVTQPAQGHDHSSHDHSGHRPSGHDHTGHQGHGGHP